PGGDGVADGAARRLLAGAGRRLDAAGDGRLRRGPQVRDRRRGLRAAGRVPPPLRALPSDRAGAGGADRRRRARQGRRPPGRGVDDRQGLRRVRRPSRLRPHPRPQRDRQEDRDQPRLGVRGDDARPPRQRGRAARRLRGLGRAPRRVPGRRCGPLRVSAPRARAELIEDRGEAAAGEDFFRSRPFLDAEGATHTLRIESDETELLAPLIVREVEGTGERDAVSPYGYPGLVEGGERPGHARRRNSGEAPSGMPRTPDALDPSVIDFSDTGLVSVFIRHALDEAPISGTTARNVVQIADPALAPKSRPSDRRQVRRNVEAGYELALVPGRETTPAQRAGFLDLYEQTMRRTEAAPHYFFAAAYFDRILEADR